MITVKIIILSLYRYRFLAMVTRPSLNVPIVPHRFKPLLNRLLPSFTVLKQPFNRLEFSCLTVNQLLIIQVACINLKIVIKTAKKWF
jgi:hypothetical protein